jgi:cytochrome c-type biogenesis protein CcmF
VLGARGRRRALGESGPLALGRAARSNPRLYGGLVVHLGVVMIAVALAASSAYSTNAEVRLRKGEQTTVNGYTLTYLGSSTVRDPQKTTTSARVRVERGDRDLGVYAPAISTYPNSIEGIGTPSVRTGIKEDVYLTLVSSPKGGGRITLAVRVNPMILWLWIGGGVMALGTVLALAPRLRRRTHATSSDLDPTDDVDPTDEVEPLEEVPA